MQARLEEALGIRAELIEAYGGAFEVTADGTLIYSKLATGEFPEDEEIVKALRSMT